MLRGDGDEEDMLRLRKRLMIHPDLVKRLDPEAELRNRLMHHGSKDPVIPQVPPAASAPFIPVCDPKDPPAQVRREAWRNRGTTMVLVAGDPFRVPLCPRHVASRCSYLGAAAEAGAVMTSLAPGDLSAPPQGGYMRSKV